MALKTRSSFIVAFVSAITLFILVISLISRYSPQKIKVAEVSTSRLPITGTFLMPDMPDSYLTETNLTPMFDEMKALGIDTLFGLWAILDTPDNADPQIHHCSDRINTHMVYFKMAYKYGMSVYMYPIAYDSFKPGNNLNNCVMEKMPLLKTAMEQQGIPFSIIKGWDMGEDPLNYYSEKGLANSMARTGGILGNLKSMYPGTIGYISPYPLGNDFTYEYVKNAFDTIFERYPELDMIIPQDSGGSDPSRNPANNAILFRALHDSVAAHPGKVGWANVESFIMPTPYDSTSLYNPTDINRLSAQIDAAAPYVPKIITWIYQHTFLSNPLYDNVGSWTQQYTPARANARRTLRQAYVARYGTGMNIPSPTPNSSSFYVDVPTTHPFYPQIEALRLASIVSNCGSTNSYCPDSPLTRAQAAVILLRAKHGGSYTPPSFTTPSFTDVPASHWAYPWIEQLKAEGITGGCNGTTTSFCPDAGVTRAEFAILLLRTKYGPAYTPTSSSTTFADTTSHWARFWIEDLKTKGITTGCGGGNFCPDNTVSRGEMAVLIYKAFNPSLPTQTPTPTPTPTSTPSPTPTPTPTSTPSPTPSPSPSRNPSIRPSPTPSPSPTSPSQFHPGDLNKDHHVNRQDYLLFLNGFGTTYSIYDYNHIVEGYEN